MVLYRADLQSVLGFPCYDNVASNAKCQRVLVLALCPVLYYWLQEVHRDRLRYSGAAAEVSMVIAEDL